MAVLGTANHACVHNAEAGVDARAKPAQDAGVESVHTRAKPAQDEGYEA
jgi:hypothetical protein